MKSNPLEPSASLLVKLGSIAVHVEEMLSLDGHEFDRVALGSLLRDKELRDWIEAMDDMALMPVKRRAK